jgi:hypothetical protein
VCTSPTVLEAEVLVWAGICHDGRTQLKIVQGTLNAIKYRDDILDPIVLPFLHQRNFDHVFQHDHARCQVARICQDFLNQNHIRVLPGRHYHRICHQLNIYGMNSAEVLAIVNVHLKHYKNCVTYLCTSGTTSHKPLSND